MTPLDHVTRSLMFPTNFKWINFSILYFLFYCVKRPFTAYNRFTSKSTVPTNWLYDTFRWQFIRPIDEKLTWKTATAGCDVTESSQAKKKKYFTDSHWGRLVKVVPWLYLSFPLSFAFALTWLENYQISHLNCHRVWRHNATADTECGFTSLTANNINPGLIDEIEYLHHTNERYAILLLYLF